MLFVTLFQLGTASQVPSRELEGVHNSREGGCSQLTPISEGENVQRLVDEFKEGLYFRK